VARARIERVNATLEERIRGLEAEVAALRAATLGGAPRPGGPAESADLLERYLHSFRGDPNGSEYFRLLVDAYAPSLLEEIALLLARQDLPGALRQRLFRILGGPRFEGDSRAIGILDSCARGPEAPAAAQHLVAIAGEQSNDLLARLLEDAPDDPTRAAFARLAQEGPGALDLLRRAALHDVPVRLAAAEALRRFRGDGFLGFAREWSAREPEAGVKQAVDEAIRAMSTIPSWHALKATGPPDAEPPARDHPNAWASREADMGIQWIELSWTQPQRLFLIRIFEVCVPGAVVEVQAVDEGGARRPLWKGTDPRTQAGVFEIAVETTPFRVKRLRILLDTDRKAGWSEIDAVEIVGPEGRAFASHAEASSSFAG
jgi:hypothetical protein